MSESGHPAMTQDALVSSYGGESMAHMRYLIFADIAEREGFKNVARLFRAIAFAEQVHARNHYQRLRSSRPRSRWWRRRPSALATRRRTSSWP